MHLRYLSIAFTAVLLFVSSANAVRGEGGGNETTAGLVSGLDAGNFKDTFEIMKSSPTASVRALMGELKVVDAAHIPSYLQEQNRDAMHVVWCIRMLRALTGLDFNAPTLHIFTQDEGRREYWLKHKYNDGVPFFAVWKSTDSVYIAPPDAQSDIIWQWSNWYKNYGQTHKYKTELPSKDDWYY